MEKEQYDIFISYRRTDADGRISGRDIGRILQNQLTQRPKEDASHYKVFFDYASLREGNFPEKIETAIRNCKVLILLLTKDALIRCADENDWIRRELRIALESNCKIINLTPTDPMNTFDGWPTTFPEELKSIKDIHIDKIEMGELLDQSVDELEKVCIRPVIPLAGNTSPIIRKGRDIQPGDWYFNPDRAKSRNGFNPEKYFPRKSVDERLYEAVFVEQRKYTILLGAPGSGKSRAVYQLLKPVVGNKHYYGMGTLADQDVIVLGQDNITKILKWLEWYAGRDHSDRRATLFFLCDQIKDVFRMLSHNDDLYRFFDLVDSLPEVRMIATSIPSAFESFRDRFKEYGSRPFENDQRMELITIPPISSDEEGNELRNWIQNEWNINRTNTSGESIGDYIPNLNKYKQGIVSRLYAKTDELPYLAFLLPAIQTIETFRRDTALFLPLMIARKNIIVRNNEFVVKRMTEALKFLIDNNIVWIADSAGNRMAALPERAFDLDPNIDDEDLFWFDGELYPDTIISTTYSYGVNEIIWKELETEDANRHIKQELTLLKDYNSADDISQAAGEYYRAVQKVSTLRRILPRIPHTDCYEDACNKLWLFVYDRCKKFEVTPEEQVEFLTTIGMLIGRSVNLERVKNAVSILTIKRITPNYDIIGELYSIGLRIDTSMRDDIENYVNDIRDRYELKGNSLFSLSRELSFYNCCFNDCLDRICHSSFYIDEIDGRPSEFDRLKDLSSNKLVSFSIKKLLSFVAEKAVDPQQWESVFDLHERVGVPVMRSELRRYFAVVRESGINQGNQQEVNENLMSLIVSDFLSRHSAIIAEDDSEGAFFYSIEYSGGFKYAHAIYQLYLEKYHQDNPRLISSVIRVVKSNEFQVALNFLVDVDARLKKEGKELNVICYNNLINKAPNISEGMGVIPYLSNIQEYTLAGLLTTLKHRKPNENQSRTGDGKDPKVFYYAYSVTMQEVFLDFRQSSFILGILFNLATTKKHETFIRDKYLDAVLGKDKEGRKCELIDYNTAIASIRIKKNYRTLEDIWRVFNTCRDHYAKKKMFVASELYSIMMKKLHFLCSHDKELLSTEQNRLQVIIDKDWSRIIRDEFFLASLYRFMPGKSILDGSGNLTNEFKKDMQSSNITQVKVFNNILLDCKNKGFDTLWLIYEFMVFYYNARGKRKSLMPDIRTVTILMETVISQEQFAMVETATQTWLGNEFPDNNRRYAKARIHAMNTLGIDIPFVKRASLSQLFRPESSLENDVVLLSNYKQKVDVIVQNAIRDISLFGSLTPSLLNTYLKKAHDIVKVIKSKRKINKVTVTTATRDIYKCLSEQLIEPYKNRLNFDVSSYVTLIKISPSDQETMKWIDALARRKEECKYNMVACRELAVSVELARYDINLSRTFFYYWEEIMDAIGYDPADANSVSLDTKRNVLSDQVTQDYDDYWRTRSKHLIREMSHYCDEYSHGNTDEETLAFIKQQMVLFDGYHIPFPVYQPSKNDCGIDFRAEVKRSH